MRNRPISSRAALFLDRDGVIIRDAGFLGRPAGVALLPGARAALRRAQQTHRLFLLTNQSGIGRGYFSWHEVEAVHARLLDLLHLPPPGIEQIAIAAEQPGEIPVYRKPSPRFLLETMAWEGLDPEQCWMVGDRLDDVRTGLRAGIRAALIAAAPAPDRPTRAYCRQHRVPIYASLRAFVADLFAESKKGHRS